MVGSINIILAGLIFFGIKDIVRAKSKKEDFLHRVGHAMRGLVAGIRSEPILTIAFLASFCNKIGVLACYTYGTLLIKD